MTNFPKAPGVYSGRQIQPRELFKSGTPQFFPSFAFLDGTLTRDTDNADSVSLLRAGLVLGKTTSTGKFRSTIIGVTSAAVSAGTVTSITVNASAAAEVARLIAAAGASVALKLIGPPTAGGTVAVTSITATSASGTTINITSATLPAVITASFITPADGSQNPSQFITQPYGVDVLDVNGNGLDATVQLIRNADIKTTNIVNYANINADCRTWLKAAMRTNNPGVVLTFSDDR